MFPIVEIFIFHNFFSAIEAWLANELGMETFQTLVEEDSNLKIAQQIGTP
jgi:hypothetical protein